MKNINVLIKPASSLCNMTCKYCFYCDVSKQREIKSYGIMDLKTSKILIDRCFEAVDQGTIGFMFQGGEPTLAGINYFRHFIEYVNSKKNDKHQINYSLQTNGLHVNDDFCKLFKDNNFLIGLSIDGMKKNHDNLRYDLKYNGSYDRINQTLNKFKEYKIEFNVLTVLTSKLAKYPKDLFNFYLKKDIKYVQLVPCLANLNENHNEFSLKPREFFNFYKVFYDEWLKEYRKGNYISVGLFDNILGMFQGAYPTLCGALGNCQKHFVIEGDASVYPCDFYVLDQYKGGNLKENSFSQIYNHDNMNKFVNEPKKMSNKCKSCKFIRMCNGNCKRMNSLYFDNDYCGYQELLTYIYNKK